MRVSQFKDHQETGTRLWTRSELESAQGTDVGAHELLGQDEPELGELASADHLGRHHRLVLRAQVVLVHPRLVHLARKLPILRQNVEGHAQAYLCPARLIVVKHGVLLPAMFCVRRSLAR